MPAVRTNRITAVENRITNVETRLGPLEPHIRRLTGEYQALDFIVKHITNQLADHRQEIERQQSVIGRLEQLIEGQQQQISQLLQISNEQHEHIRHLQEAKNLGAEAVQQLSNRVIFSLRRLDIVEEALVDELDQQDNNNNSNNNDEELEYPTILAPQPVTAPATPRSRSPSIEYRPRTPTPEEQAAF